MQFPRLDFDRYHLETLPAALDAGRAALVTQGVHGLGPLAFQLRDGGACGYRAIGDGRPLDDATRLDLRERVGNPLDVERPFTLTMIPTNFDTSSASRRRRRGDLRAPAEGRGVR